MVWWIENNKTAVHAFLAEISCKWEQSHQVYLNAMPSAARYSWNKQNAETKEISCQRIQSQVYLNYVECSRNSLSKKRPIIAHIILLIFRKPHLKMPGKNYKKFAWVDWKNYYLHRRKLQKSFLYSWLKQLSCNFFLVPLGAFHVGFLKLKQ